MFWIRLVAQFCFGVNINMKPMNQRRSAAQALITTAVLAIFLGGCAEPMTDTQRRTAIGAGLGAATGAIISSSTGGKAGTGALIGGVLGGVGGNLWSRHMEQQKKAMEDATRGTGVEVARTEDDQLKLNVPSDVSFSVGRADIKPELRQVLEKFTQGMKSQPSTLVRVVGHTDSTGSDAVNNPLSLDRAESVRSYLVDRGINANRVEVVGRGSREPIAGNGTAEGRAKNRRVEIFMREPQSGS
jgi:outer membrane protein OmpA-like peptidoglycan-associated protein